MRSERVALNLNSPPAMSRPSTSSSKLLGIGSGTPQEGSFSGYDGSSQLFYDNYAKFPTSGYGSSWQKTDCNAPLSCCLWSNNDPSIRPHSSYVLAGVHPPVLSENVDFNAHPPPQPPALKSMLVRDLPPADPGMDYMERISPISAEDPLSPLSLYQDQLPLDLLQQDGYLTTMSVPRKWTQDRPHPTHPDEDDQDQVSPLRRPHQPLQDIHHQELDKWVMSPDSEDTDLDDESILSSSTSSLSPPFSESDLRHFVESEEENEDDYDDRCFSHFVPTPGCSLCKLSASSPMQSKTDSYFFSTSSSSNQNPSHMNPSTMTDLYHPIEQYPSHHTHLYNSTEQQCQREQHPSNLPYHQNGDTQQQQSPLSLPSQCQQMIEESPPPELSQLSDGVDTPMHESTHLDTFSRHLSSSFPPFYGCSGISQNQIPSSPLLRRVAELPPLEDELFCVQNPVYACREYDPNLVDPLPGPRRRTQWLSLPGADTDDDLIPQDLASKNYIPDPTITVPSSHSGNLLIWGPTSPRLLPLDYLHDDEPAPPRSPSPENIKLDSATISELAPEGEVEEAQRLYQLRKKTRKQHKWERERCRELSALLRLKLKLAEKGESSSDNGKEEEEERKETTIEQNDSMMEKCKDQNLGNLPSIISHSASSSSSSSTLSASTTRRSKSLPTPISDPPFVDSTRDKNIGPSPSKPAKIMSMDQLVAKMVFHRQQDLLKRPPTRKPTINIMQRTQHQTPRSPLRQVSLPQDWEQGGEVDHRSVDVVDGVSKYRLSPSSSPDLYESPLSMMMELDPIQLDGQEHDANRFRMTV